MLRYILILLLLFQLSACKKKQKENSLSESFNANSANLLSKSNFSSNAHSTSGCVSLYSENGIYNLVFESFKTDSGPDLRVYFSKSLSNNDFMEVGKLKATQGDFFYTVDPSINTNDYHHVLIWCEDYSVLFGNAQL